MVIWEASSWLCMPGLGPLTSLDTEPQVSPWGWCLSQGPPLEGPAWEGTQGCLRLSLLLRSSQSTEIGQWEGE